MAGIFKAYDVRGVYPDELDENMAHNIGRAYRSILDPQRVRDGQPVVVGRDMRDHSVPLQTALIEGLQRSGIDTLDIGLATTPMNYFAVGHLNAAGGIQVTASHNPARYNGLKFSLHGARPVSGDDGIPLLEQCVTTGDYPSAQAPGAGEVGEIFPAYRDHVLAQLQRPESGRRLKVAVDAANGMGSLYRPLLEAAGIDIVPLYFELDGSFPNHEANPLKMENLRDLQEAVRSHGADVGVCFDGDADRAAFIDEQGAAIGSDLMTALIAGRRLARSHGGVVLYDVRSSRAVPEYIREHGGQPQRERVGHSFVKATLRKQDGLFGGELAGHYYFRENYYADSSILAVFEVLNLLWSEQKPLSELVEPLRRYAKSEEINFEVEDKKGMMDRLAERYSDGQIDWLDGVTVDFEEWWFNVRPSNTEPLLRLVLEATDDAMLEAKKAELMQLLGQPV